MRKAVVYARVSSKEQEQGFSLDAQLKLTRRYAGEHQFEVVREFSFWESAKQQGRKHFNEMLRFLRQNPDCRVIIVEKTDRLLRNLHDYVAIEDLVEELNAEVHLVKEGQIISKTSRSQDKLVQGMHVVLARNYILNMKEEITKGQTIKAEKGQYPGRAMFGYMHDRATRTIVANPKRGPVVTLIFDLYESGMHSMQSLQRKIRDATGERISKAHLARMLKNRFYLDLPPEK
jgi:site-specific DNA recombinase